MGLRGGGEPPKRSAGGPEGVLVVGTLWVRASQRTRHPSTTNDGPAGCTTCSGFRSRLPTQIMHTHQQ